MEIFEPLKIKGLGPIELPENWKFVKIIGNNTYIITHIVNQKNIIQNYYNVDVIIIYCLNIVKIYLIKGLPSTLQKAQGL